MFGVVMAACFHTKANLKAVAPPRHEFHAGKRIGRITKKRVVTIFILPSPKRNLVPGMCAERVEFGGDFLIARIKLQGPLVTLRRRLRLAQPGQRVT